MLARVLRFDHAQQYLGRLRSICWSIETAVYAPACSGEFWKTIPISDMIHTQWGEGLRSLFR